MPEVNRLNADRWNAARSCQYLSLSQTATLKDLVLNKLRQLSTIYGNNLCQLERNFDTTTTTTTRNKLMGFDPNTSNLLLLHINQGGGENVSDQNLVNKLHV